MGESGLQAVPRASSQVLLAHPSSRPHLMARDAVPYCPVVSREEGKVSLWPAEPGSVMTPHYKSATKSRLNTRAEASIGALDCTLTQARAVKVHGTWSLTEATVSGPLSPWLEGQALMSPECGTHSGLAVTSLA